MITLSPAQNFLLLRWGSPPTRFHSVGCRTRCTLSLTTFSKLDSLPRSYIPDLSGFSSIGRSRDYIFYFLSYWIGDRSLNYFVSLSLQTIGAQLSFRPNWSPFSIIGVWICCSPIFSTDYLKYFISLRPVFELGTGKGFAWVNPAFFFPFWPKET